MLLTKEDGPMKNTRNSSKVILHSNVFWSSFPEFEPMTQSFLKFVHRWLVVTFLRFENLWKKLEETWELCAYTKQHADQEPRSEVLHPDTEDP